MARGDIKMAMSAMRKSRWHSLLTMLGIIIGVVSVVTTVSLGEGIKQQIVGQINRGSSDLITVRPGKIITRQADGQISGINPFSSFNFGSLSENDFQTIKTTSDVKEAAPFAYISGVATADGRDYSSGPIIATNEKASELLNQKVVYGGFFSGDEMQKNVAVIGKRVAEQLFQENVPIGRSFTLRDQTFFVHGVFDEFKSSPLAINADYNYAIFIPYDSSKHISSSQLQIYQILARPDSSDKTNQSVQSITQTLRNAHSGQTDFSVLTQNESLAVANSTLNLLTTFIAGIAAISLFVGGIGIMNIMLLSVTERTREIGLRKAIGATNRQILGQFLLEAVILSVVGGLIGVALSLILNYFIRLLTSLAPVINWQIILVAVLVAVMVGIIFGITPAVRAAHKDPIDALRHE